MDLLGEGSGLGLGVVRLLHELVEELAAANVLQNDIIVLTVLKYDIRGRKTGIRRRKDLVDVVEAADVGVVELFQNGGLALELLLFLLGYRKE